MTSPFNQAQTPCPKKGFALIQDLLLTLVTALAQAAAAGATPTIMCLMMTAMSSGPLKCNYSYSKNNNDGYYHHPDKRNTVFATFTASMGTINNVLRTLVHTNPPRNMTQARDIIDDALATAMHSMQTTIATTLGSTPAALAFAQDMFLNLPLIADWQAIARTCEPYANES
jgi:hypothetical protein